MNHRIKKIKLSCIIQVDVIVNTTGKNLDLRNGAVSASLLRAGGDALQQDLTQNYPKGLGDGEIAISVGGKLHCFNIFHGSLMNWDGGDKAIPVNEPHHEKACLPGSH